jgi:hypothetical protein
MSQEADLPSSNAGIAGDVSIPQPPEVVPAVLESGAASVVDVEKTHSDISELDKGVDPFLVTWDGPDDPANPMVRHIDPSSAFLHKRTFSRTGLVLGNGS